MATKSSVRDQSTGTKFKAEPVSRVVPKIKGRERKEVQLLLERGRMQGHLTYDELNEALPPDMVTSDQIDDLMRWLKSEDIDVVDGAPEGQSRTSQAPVAATRSSVRRSATIPPPADDSYAQKSNDPVRMYLRKMGSVSLLTREGEVEIAKRIEEGEDLIFNVILNSVIGVSEILEIGESPPKGQAARQRRRSRPRQRGRGRFRGRQGPRPQALRQGQAHRVGDGQGAERDREQATGLGPGQEAV